MIVSNLAHFWHTVGIVVNYLVKLGGSILKYVKQTFAGLGQNL